jgi:hypothetical protein
MRRIKQGRRRRLEAASKQAGSINENSPYWFWQENWK